MTPDLNLRYPIRHWFAGLIENSFQTQLGMADPSLLDYLAEMLTDFVHVERIHSLTDGSGRRVEDLTDLLYTVRGSTDPAGEERVREIHRHIGDFTLFWTGVYPENIRRLKRRHERDELVSYFRQGKRSYAIASRLSDESSRPPRRLLELLSDEFEACVYGLGLVRSEWERGGFRAVG